LACGVLQTPTRIIQLIVALVDEADDHPTRRWRVAGVSDRGCDRQVFQGKPPQNEKDVLNVCDTLHGALKLRRAQLERLLDEYVTHYNACRPHRGLGQRAPDDRDVVEYRPGRPIRRHTSCNGLINEYHQAA
jgi:hypothetical protein